MKITGYERYVPVENALKWRAGPLDLLMIEAQKAIQTIINKVGLMHKGSFRIRVEFHPDD